MNLSRALLVMLLLHLVALSGYLAFEYFIKERPAPHASHPPTTASVVPSPSGRFVPPPPASSENPASRPVPLAVANPARPVPSPGSRAETDALRLIEGGPAGAERTYTVSRGETLTSIAQKLRLNQDALLRVNDIDDPRRIHVGQKLRLPPAVKPKS